MADRVEELERRIRELEDQVANISEQSRGRNELGSPRKPIRAIYLLDEATGAVAKINWDRGSSDIASEEV